MYRWLSDAVADDGVVVTASRRLARELRTVFDQWQIDAGRRAWATPDIRSWNDWLTGTLDTASSAVDLPLRIDLHCSVTLWEIVLREHNAEQILNFGGMVRQAFQSWQRVNEWQVPLRDLSKFAQSRDQDLFASAAWSYQKFLGKNNWADSAGLAPLVSNLLGGNSISLPRRMTVAGFDRLTPAVESVFARIRQRGCDVDFAPVPHLASHKELVSYIDVTAELRAAGAWARDLLQKNRDAKLAVVSPGLEADAEGVGRLIREGLAPGWQYGGPSYRSAASVSYGAKLAHYPLIATALSVLRWAADGLGTRDISVLLRSPFMGGPVAAGRTRLELEFRRLPDRLWKPGELCSLFDRRNLEPDAARWLNSIRLLEELRLISHQERAPSEWAARIDRLIGDVDWPGLERPDSKEFQLINRWRELLNELAGTETVAKRMTLNAALRRLSGIAADAIYQPEVESGMLQVLGPLEAIGMEFDAIWVTGLDATKWPSSGSPSAFIARSLQRRHGMPDSTPEDTLDYSRVVLRRLLASAPRVILSWPQTDGESELFASPLLDEFELQNATGFADPGWHAASFLDRHRVTAHDTDPVPPVGNNERVAGGAYTVQRQIQEPLAAFAMGRLRITDIPPIESGLTAATRGSLIHHALHALYRDCPRSSSIRNWSVDERRTRVADAVDGALAPHLRTADDMHRRLLELEHARLQNLLKAFLDTELARSDFSVAAVEMEIDFERHGVCLGLRLDRMDRLADGSILIVDYKTGATKNFLNREGRPADFQLVVYSCAVDEPVGGLALINIDSRGIQHKAAGGSTDWGRVDQEAWAGRLAEWQATVDSALQQLAAGDVRINLRLPAQEGRALNLLSRFEEHRRAE